MAAPSGLCGNFVGKSRRAEPEPLAALSQEDTMTWSLPALFCLGILLEVGYRYDKAELRLVCAIGLLPACIWATYEMFTSPFAEFAKSHLEKWILNPEVGFPLWFSLLILPGCIFVLLGYGASVLVHNIVKRKLELERMRYHR